MSPQGQSFEILPCLWGQTHTIFKIYSLECEICDPCEIWPICGSAAQRLAPLWGSKFVCIF